jgi:hypothetical protein
VSGVIFNRNFCSRMKQMLIGPFVAGPSVEALMSHNHEPTPTVSIYMHAPMYMLKHVYLDSGVD